MRAAAFVSGGLVPAAKRGTTSDVVLHIADWYATFCVAAGVSPEDDAPFPPKPIDPADPSVDIYGATSWPAVDGRDALPALFGASADPRDMQAVHKRLWLSAQVLIQGRYKLLVSQPLCNIMSANSVNNGWRLPTANGTAGDWTCKKGQPGEGGLCREDYVEFPCSYFPAGVSQTPTGKGGNCKALNQSMTRVKPCLFGAVLCRMLVLLLLLVHLALTSLLQTWIQTRARRITLRRRTQNS